MAARDYIKTLICLDFNHRTINWNSLYADSEEQTFIDVNGLLFNTTSCDNTYWGLGKIQQDTQSEESIAENVGIIEFLWGPATELC